MNPLDNSRTIHCLAVGEKAPEKAIEDALMYHMPIYERDSSRRTRISLVFSGRDLMDDFIFEYKELLDNSFYRMVELKDEKVESRLHKPVYHGLRKDFVDVEWELIIGKLSHPALQQKIDRWSRDPRQQLIIQLCYANSERNRKYAKKLRNRLPENVVVETVSGDGVAPGFEDEELKLIMAKCLNYCYKKSFEEGKVPVELPWEEVERAWEEIPDETSRMSNIYNVSTIPFKMQILGHDRADWDKYYALTLDEIESLTAVEHNRWSVERLIQGMRPCTDVERQEIAEDFERRKSDKDYAEASPLTLKKRYARERGAHYDLAAYSELGVDETGLPVSRYDRDLTMAIPLIVKTAADRVKTMHKK